MAAWIRYSRHRFAYDGRISRTPFARWTATPRGRHVVDDVASGVRFALFGRQRAARRRLWRGLADTARDAAVAAAVQAEAQQYFKHMGDLAYADGLVREAVDLRRLVVVPSVLVNGDMYGALEARLRREPAFAALQGGSALREFFLLTLVEDLDAAAMRARPSLTDPLAAGAGWLVVGGNPSFHWRAPVADEPEWPGHRFVLEVTREPITRAVRKAVAAAITRVETALPSLTRVQRNEMLRRARRVA